MLLPLVILIGTYIPQYSHAHTAMQQNTLLVSQRIEEITKALDPVCEYISADDPAERYQDYGYRVIGYLRGMNTDAPKCYVYISLDSTGVLESLSYDEEIIMSLSLEENLSRIEKDFETLHRVLQKADIPTQSPELLTTYQLSEEFREAFLAGTYYQSIDCSEMVKAPVFIGALKPNPRKNLMNTPIPAYTSMCGRKSLGGRSVKYPLGWQIKTA